MKIFSFAETNFLRILFSFSTSRSTQFDPPQRPNPYLPHLHRPLPLKLLHFAWPNCTGIYLLSIVRYREKLKPSALFHLLEALTGSSIPASSKKAVDMTRSEDILRSVVALFRFSSCSLSRLLESKLFIQSHNRSPLEMNFLPPVPQNEIIVEKTPVRKNAEM